MSPSHHPHVPPLLPTSISLPPIAPLHLKGGSAHTFASNISLPPLAPPPPPLKSRLTSPSTHCSAPPMPTALLNNSINTVAYKPAHHKLSPAALRGLTNDEIVEVDPEKIIHEAVERYKKFMPEIAACRMEVFNRPTQPQLQEGPQCGLVALCTASRLFQARNKITPNILLQMAKDKGYTKQGEMFSALNLADLATSLLNAEVTVEEADVLADDDQLVRDILGGDVFLVPYDCDFNHGPCQAEGKKAHWGLLTGFILVSSEIGPVSVIKPEQYLLSAEDLDNKKLMILGRQSKSLVLGVWDKESLVASNKNLFVLDPKRSPEEYIIPSGGVGEGLANKIIRIKRP